MKILLSIKPEYVQEIFDGKKYYEFRKTIFKNKEVDTVLVYSTSPVKMIVGEFKIKSIVKDNPKKLWELSPNNTGISKEKFLNYFKNKDIGYAIEIGKYIKYKKPKELMELGIKVAPQSFIYIK